MTGGGRPTWSFILVAAGSGSRLGGIPKQFRTLGSAPVWVWAAETAERLYADGKIDELIVVFPSFFECAMDEDLFECPVKYVTGGSTRTESVINGLKAAGSDYAMIHDAARPFLSVEVCDALMAATDEARGAIPLIPSVDSLKEIDGESMTVARRGKIFRTQTPQCFKRESILEVLEACGTASTDEASSWLASGREMKYIDGDERNFKITTEFDWCVATSLTARCREIRTGLGYDVHELVPGRKLILGGVEVDSSLGLLGHSDADIICHAVADSLLGAAGEGDIGTMFPASDDAYKNADSMGILSAVLKNIKSKGWRVVWLDVTLVAQVPRLASVIPAISENLSKSFTPLGLGNKLSVKVKSGELVGSVGRADCMTCYSSATIERVSI